MIKQKHILIIHTGGTIAMHSDNKTKSVEQSTVNPLLNHDLNHIFPNTQFMIKDLLHLPSPSITPEHMLHIQQYILNYQKNNPCSGVVITHGTDTLEETAFFLDLTLPTDIPIVLTGAMRSSNHVGTDGLYNLHNAIRVALYDDSKHKGVLVVMNDEIHTAKHVTKTHTTNVATFQSPSFGPVGLITEQHILYTSTPYHDPILSINSVSGTVPIIKAYAGMDETLFELLQNTHIQGIVIEALGAGNMPEKTIPALRQLLQQNIPVALVSRCFNGVAEPVYYYPGGGKQLEELGVIFCPGLNGAKARLKLLIGTNAGLTHTELKAFLNPLY